ncbi:hypothetical protein O181_103118 [Austropuccinia psidii MF-1]|uniref:Tc1-like transposase DDE domain-containing protein n=1 Tax=Austropuccinia psidii MF-1 TaxID=1389203 RepID=A0A9Q3PIS1_9BASI|nr:hypothetical protein [Austropuccinia psidii MF-1]
MRPARTRPYHHLTVAQVTNLMTRTIQRKIHELGPWICGCHCLLLMEDNAPIHKAQASTDWQDWHEIQKLDWPAHSPDFNPIKNVWKTMKHQTSELYQPQMVEELWHMIKPVWTDFHVNLLNNLL